MGLSISIPRGELKEAVGGLGKITAGRSSLPVLGCVRLEAGDGGVSACATDLDQVLEYRFEGGGAKAAGACILPLAALRDLAKGDKEGHVEIEADDPLRVGVINHVGGHAVRQILPGTELEEWPGMPPPFATRPSAGFLDTFRRLAPFASTDSTRHILNSVYVETGKGERSTAMTATDGRRLASCNGMTLPLRKSVVVPVTRCLAWSGLGTETAIGVREAGERVWLAVEAGRFRYRVLTLEGTYPNYRQVIPSQAGDHVVTFTDGDAALLKQVLPAFPGGDEVTLVGQDGAVVLCGRNPGDEAWSTVRLEHTAYAGERVFIGLDRHYLLDALAAGFREFRIADELSPVLSRDDRGGTHVIMPMRVEDPGTVAVDRAPAPAAQAGPADAGAGETPVDKQAPPAKAAPERRKRTMTGRKETTQAPGLDDALAAVETAKAGLREATRALSDVSAAVKAAVREGRAQEAEIRKAREIIGKLQTISLKAA